MASLFKLVICLFVFAGTISAKGTPEEVSTLLKDILHGTYNPGPFSYPYDKQFPPPGNEPVIVETSIIIRSFEMISMSDEMKYTVELTHRRAYNDSRLSFRSEIDLAYISLRDPSVIWTPFVMFSNSLDRKIHDQYGLFYRNGSVVFSERISLTVLCPTYLTNYPFDVQTCPIKISTNSLTTDQQVITWKPGRDAAIVLSRFKVPGFKLLNVTTSDITTKTSSGEYSAIQMNLVLKREISFYLIKVFIPITMLVIVSWIGFFISAKDQFLKSIISLLVLITLVLALTIMNKDFPRIDYTTVLDVWAGTCVAFVFVALIESVIVYLCSRNCDRKTEFDHLTDSEDKNMIVVDGDKLINKMNRKCDDICQRTKLAKLDLISILLFPSLFVLFNIAYFSYYCTRE